MKWQLLVLGMSLFLITACQQDQQKTEEKEETTEEQEVGKAFDGQVKELQSTALPEWAQLEGKLQKAVSFTDLQGENLLVAYLAGPTPDPDSEDEDAYAANLQLALFRNQEANPVWGYSIAEPDCPFDLWIGFDSLTVTDLDKNGHAELGMVMTHSCRSDVSPSNLEVIILEQDKAYIIKGGQWLPPLGEMPLDSVYALADIEDKAAYTAAHDMPAIWGRYEVMGEANDFSKTLKAYADQLWGDHQMERSFRSLDAGD